MKSVLLVVAAMAAACGTSDGLHDVVTCGSDWGSGYAGCESACVDYPASVPTGSDVNNMCLATDPRDGSHYDCILGTIVPDGVRGCCTPRRTGSASGSGFGVAKFYECN